MVATYLARCNGRTLDASRQDLRTYFKWVSNACLAVLNAEHLHIEFYRTSDPFDLSEQWSTHSPCGGASVGPIFSGHRWRPQGCT